MILKSEELYLLGFKRYIDFKATPLSELIFAAY